MRCEPSALWVFQTTSIRASAAKDNKLIAGWAAIFCSTRRTQIASNLIKRKLGIGGHQCQRRNRTRLPGPLGSAAWRHVLAELGRALCRSEERLSSVSFIAIIPKSRARISLRLAMKRFASAAGTQRGPELFSACLLAAQNPFVRGIYWHSRERIALERFQS